MDESQLVWQRLGERGASLTCPVCGHETWQAFGELGNLRVALQAATSHGDLVNIPGQRGGFGAYIFACGKCGFLRLHSTQVVGEVAELDE